MTMTNRAPAPQFKVGDKVTAVAFTDCFGKHHPAKTGYTVEKITLHDNRTPPDDFQPYYRVLAYRFEPFASVEGAESFFETA